MKILIYIIPLLLLLFTLYKTYKSQRRFLLELKLVSLYDKVELYILKTRPHLSNIDIKFLEANKNIAVNPQFLDIKFIIAINQIIEEKDIKVDNKWYINYVEKEGEELKNLLVAYTNTQVELSLLSALKSKFIFKALWIKANNFVHNKTVNLSELFKSRIEQALYSGNNINTLAGC